MTNETSPVQASAQAISGAGSTPSRASTSGAAKVFREFKWGLLTLFLLMVVVIGLVYDGGRKNETKKPPQKGETPRTATLPDQGLPPGGSAGFTAQPAGPQLPTNGQPPVDQGTAGEGVQPPQPGPVQVPQVPTQMPVYRPTGHEVAGPVTQPGPETRQPGLTVPPTREEATRGEYLVQPGDTLEGIARKNYPGRTYTAVKAIAKANGIADPRRLRAGMTLKLPRLAEPSPTSGNGGRQTADPLTPSTPRTNMQPGEDDVYLVQAGDTLEQIARKVLKDGRRWRDIYEWNRDRLRDPRILQIGQELKIEKDAAKAVEATREQDPQEDEVERAPHRTVVQQEEPADEEGPARPQPADRVEPLQRWMP